VAAGVGLWDPAAGRYLVPGAAASATRPGGAGGLAAPAAFFNVAFRAAEPPQTITDTSALTDGAWWRDRLQAHALGRRRPLPLLRRRRLRQAGPPGRRRERRAADRLDERILSSRFEGGQGVDWAVGCGASATDCPGQLQGRLQPYAIYVPRGRPAGGRYQLTLLLHSLTANYNQYAGSRNVAQFAQRERPSIVITPEGRGPDGFYNGVAGADTFEVWADVARRYHLDPRRTAITGYSMGGFGTFKLAAQYPDLFARAQPTSARCTFRPRCSHRCAGCPC
jgi:hypothetical protein